MATNVTRLKDFKIVKIERDPEKQNYLKLWLRKGINETYIFVEENQLFDCFGDRFNINLKYW